MALLGIRWPRIPPRPRTPNRVDVVTMSPRTRKLALTLHVTSSVGWLGAVVGSLVLAVVGLVSQEPQVVRAVYQALEPFGRYVLVPFSLASLVSGLAQSLGTHWGLFRHHWVVFKLLINVLASVILLLYTQTLVALAQIAASSGDLSVLRSPSPVLHASAAIAVLLVAMILSIYKPRSMTRYGQRKQAAPVGT